jgi:hypothetical protein
MPFKSVFVAVVIGTAMIVAALLVSSHRPSLEREQPTPALVEATGKCAECHRHQTPGVVAQFERSRHAGKGVTCLDCHQPGPGSAGLDHHGFTIAKVLTSQTCASCHATEYDQFARSRHAGPAWAAVHGTSGFSPAQVAQGERYHKGWIDRTPMGIGALEGSSALTSGCDSCHAIGRPNGDGSFGTCTNCHSRHNASVTLAREPATCGQCHMGPDHSQVEIYEESKHGALFHAQQASMRLDAPPALLKASDMSVPTCATCHMSGLEGAGQTHDTTERLSWYLFAPISAKRPGYERAQAAMKDVCTKCHARSHIDEFFARAEDVVKATNEKVEGAIAVMDGLRKEGLVSPKAFQDPISFDEFDLWHYYGRTAKHGAFMGGADFVQWHGNYELLRLRVQIDRQASDLRAAHARPL